MDASVKWLNRYLDPADLSPDEALRVLEATSFPIEERRDLPDGDAVLDVEITSNRGDCVSHLGLAREIASVTGRSLKTPAPTVTNDGDAVTQVTSVDNQTPDLCPLFTARVIKGVTVGPSPAWLADLLERIGQRPINNVVDVSNFVLFELGHPSHTFDLATLADRRLIVRHAKAGERLSGLDGAKHELRPPDLVVADAQQAVSLAGVAGGVETGVTERTTDVLLEVATWDPATIRRTARRLDVRTDAGYRFERIVDPRDLAWASARCAELILELAGGELVDGLIAEGRPLEPRTRLDVRQARVPHVLGIEIPADEGARLLRAVGFDVEIDGAGADAVLACAVPHHRPDVTREIDVVEEIARLHGIDNFPIAPRLEVPLEIDHPKEWADREHAVRAIADALTGLGFYETVTFSFLAREHAEPFLPGGLRLIKIDEERRRDTPFLRPSVIPSLLTCRRANQDGRVEVDGGVRLFEIASVFAEEDDGDERARKTVENRNVAMLIDAGTGHEQHQHALRAMRGAIDVLLQHVGGGSARAEITPMPKVFPIQGDGPFAGVRAGDAHLGYLGLLRAKDAAPWGVDQAVVVAELGLEALLALFPPEDEVRPLPTFPGIERDVSLVLDETTPRVRISSLVDGLSLERLERCDFVGVFRGKQVGAGRKSVTLRLGFRDPRRTLRHEEVDPEVDRVVAAAKAELDAELRV